MPASGGHHLAQVNVARSLEPLDSERLAPFVALLEQVNARADAAPGFVWRLQDEGGDATAFRFEGDADTLINLSVWKSPEALRAFVYEDSEHLAALRRRREWFERIELVLALWWIPAGERPSLADAAHRLEMLERDGPTPKAFTFREVFAPPAGASVAGM